MQAYCKPKRCLCDPCVPCCFGAFTVPAPEQSSGLSAVSQCRLSRFLALLNCSSRHQDSTTDCKFRLRCSMLFVCACEGMMRPQHESLYLPPVLDPLKLQHSPSGLCATPRVPLTRPVYVCAGRGMTQPPNGSWFVPPAAQAAAQPIRLLCHTVISINVPHVRL